MTVSPDTPTPTQIGPYPVERELGRGGMGIVYLARDPRLDRLVAIKALPESFSKDADRLRRFEQEAKTLASLNHRNLAAIYDLEESDGQRLLILEYVPGESLSERIAQGPLPIDESLRVCAQIAEGLEAAHERGIVHRDLKPDNVKITPEGVVKILDFGIATNSVQAALGPPAVSAASATIISTRTAPGMVIGTPGYMSPEQARGKPVDKRTDIWSFGCILYECLSGHMAFGGSTSTDSIAAIIERDPDWTPLPTRTPTAIRQLVQRCLHKDSRNRLRDIGDARIEINELLAKPRTGWFKPADAGAGAGGAATGGTGARPVARFTLTLPPGEALTNARKPSLAFSPDGQRIAYVVGRPPKTQLLLRRIDQLDAKPIPGTEGADSPFFSPDGTRLGFFADGKLKKIPVTGGNPLTICNAPRHHGACWDQADVILFVPDLQMGLAKVPAAGGSPTIIAEPDAAKGERAYLSPELLPGGRVALFTIWSGAGFDDATIAAINLKTGERKPLIQGGCEPRFAPSGHIVYTRAGALMAVAFDPERLEVTGHPTEVLAGVLTNALGGSAHFAFSSNGSLVYASGEVWLPHHSLLWTTRQGETAPVTQEQRPFLAPFVSGDGRRLVVQLQGPSDHLWVYDLDRNAATRLTFDADNACPVLSPDGQRIAFRSNLNGMYELYWMPADGSGQPQRLLQSEFFPVPCSFSPDGKTLAFVETRPQSGADIWLLPLQPDDAGGPPTPRPFVQTPFNEWGAAFSPDGKLLAYASDVSGRSEIYLQSYPGPGGKWQVTTDGGTAPLWAPSGRELFYRSQDTVYAVRIATEPTFMAGRPRPLFEAPYLAPTHSSPNYAVGPDDRLVMVQTHDDQAPVTQLTVVLNWFDEIARRLNPDGAGGARSA